MMSLNSVLHLRRGSSDGPAPIWASAVRISCYARTANKPDPPPYRPLFFTQALADAEDLEPLMDASEPAVASTPARVRVAGGGRTVDVLVFDGGSAHVLVYVHGGSYTAYDPADPWYAGFCGRLAVGCRATVVSVRYRLAPSAPFPAALDDVGAALAYAGPAAVLVGDSAGAGLAVAAALRYPCAGVVGLSGLYDLTASTGTYATADDPIFAGGADEERRATIRDGLAYLGRDQSDAAVCAVLSAAAAPPPRTLFGRLRACFRGARVGDRAAYGALADGRVSPLLAAGLGQLARCLLLVGGREVLLGDSLALAARAGAADVVVYAGMWHDWFLYAEGRGAGGGARLLEADDAVDRVAAWLAAGP